MPAIEKSVIEKTIIEKFRIRYRVPNHWHAAIRHAGVPLSLLEGQEHSRGSRADARGLPTRPVYTGVDV
jgi:hypothetical protein